MPPGQVIFTIALKLTASQVKRRVENFSRLQSPRTIQNLAQYDECDLST